MKGRHLRESVWRVINIINFSMQEEATMLGLFIDAEKAFDHVEWFFCFVSCT